MKPRKQRMIFVGVIVAGVAAATVLVLLAMGENMMYFYSPTQIRNGEAPEDTVIRAGGLVVEDSVQRDPDSLEVNFRITDTQHQLAVGYEGILPDLFREGQGIVAIGRLDDAGVLRADKVLAKHDENYMPPEVADALETAREGGAFIPSPHDGER